MSRNSLTLTVTLRKISTGFGVTGFQIEDQNHAYSIARILICSPQYAGTYAVATDWRGETVFNIQPGSPEQQAAQVAPYQLPHDSAPAQYRPQTVPREPYPQHNPAPMAYGHQGVATGHPNVVAARPAPRPPQAWGAPQPGNPHAPIPRALSAPAASGSPIPPRALPAKR